MLLSNLAFAVSPFAADFRDIHTHTRAQLLSFFSRTMQRSRIDSLIRVNGRAHGKSANLAKSARFFQPRSSFPRTCSLPSYVDFSSFPSCRIAGSRLLSRSREFRFSRIGEMRRIDGNLISRGRTTVLKDFGRACVRVSVYM